MDMSSNIAVLWSKQVISSMFVKEIAKLNGTIDNFVTKSTVKAIKEKYD